MSVKDVLMLWTLAKSTSTEAFITPVANMVLMVLKGVCPVSVTQYSVRCLLNDLLSRT